MSCTARDRDFFLWVGHGLDEIIHWGHTDPQVCAPPSLKIFAVLETWLVSAVFVYGFVELMAGEHCSKSFEGNGLLVYSLSHADCEEQRQ